jgi:hypothetical protein
MQLCGACVNTPHQRLAQRKLSAPFARRACGQALSKKPLGERTTWWNFAPFTRRACGQALSKKHSGSEPHGGNLQRSVLPHRRLHVMGRWTTATTTCCPAGKQGQTKLPNCRVERRWSTRPLPWRARTLRSHSLHRRAGSDSTPKYTPCRRLLDFCSLLKA